MANQIQMAQISPQLQNQMQTITLTQPQILQPPMQAIQNVPSQNEQNNIYNQKELDVNNYYILKYKSESEIFKLIIFFCGLALFGCFFFLKGWIGETLYIIYLGFIIAIGLFYVIYKIYDVKYRDNQHFDEYQYGYMQHPGTDLSDNTIELKIKKSENIDSNSDKNKCI